MKHVTTEVPRDINAKARLMARNQGQTLSGFLADVLTREVTRLWKNRPEEEEKLRTIVREELSRAFD
jgi:hypothetical protein